MDSTLVCVCSWFHGVTCKTMPKYGHMWRHNCHMGEMRDSDWSRPNLLRSDWLLPIGAIMTTQTLATARTSKVRTGWLSVYRWFWKFFNGLVKIPRVLRSSWILNECNWCCKIVKYCILSEVCMIKTVPHSTVSPQMWCITGIKGWFTRTQICWHDFVK